MAYKTRKLPDVMVNTLVAAWNAKQEAQVAALFHADITQKTSGDYLNPTVASDLVSAANGTDDATNIVLANDLLAVVDRHFADVLAHDTAVSAALTLAAATDAATALALVNDIKDKYNTHLSATDVHFNDDSTNDVTNSDGTDQATVSVVANEMKGDVNAHVISAPVGSMIELVSA